MAVKILEALTTLPTQNEQSGVGQATVTGNVTFKEKGIAAAFSRALVWFDVSAISGATATLTVFIEGRLPDIDKWVTLISDALPEPTPSLNRFPAQTAVTPATPLPPVAINPLYYDHIRCRVTLTGTSPSCTFSCAMMLMTEEPIL